MKSDTKHHQRSYGAAHGAAFGRSMMFGSRGPLLSPEGDGNSAAPTGETTSTSTTTTTTGTPGTAPAGASGEKLLTQAQVNALVAQARREGRESAAQPLTQTTTQPKATTPTAGEAQPMMTAEAVQQLMQRERAFTRVTATAGLNDKQLARMEAAFNADKPADVAAWSTTYLEDMGFAKPSTTTIQNPNGITPPAVPGLPPAAAPTVPSAVNPMTSGGLTDIFNLSGDQIEQLGPQGMRAEFEKIITAGRRNSGAPPRPVMQRK